MTFEPNRPDTGTRGPAERPRGAPRSQAGRPVERPAARDAAPAREAPMPQVDPFLPSPGPRAAADPLPPAEPGLEPAATGPVRNPTEARQGSTTGRVRWVLGIGIVAVVILFGLAYLFAVG